MIIFIIHVFQKYILSVSLPITKARLCYIFEMDVFIHILCVWCHAKHLERTLIVPKAIKSRRGKRSILRLTLFSSWARQWFANSGFNKSMLYLPESPGHHDWSTVQPFAPKLVNDIVVSPNIVRCPILASNEYLEQFAQWLFPRKWTEVQRK